MLLFTLYNMTHCIMFNTQFNAKVHTDLLLVNSENWQIGDSQQFYPKDYERFNLNEFHKFQISQDN